jgi:hypothetical protein
MLRARAHGAAHRRTDPNRNGDAAAYVGVDVHRCARISAAAHGGQVLLSQTTRDLVHSHLPADVSLRDLGQCRLKDLAEEEHLYNLLSAICCRFSPLRISGQSTLQPADTGSPIVGVRVKCGRLATVAAPDCIYLTLTGTGGTGKHDSRCSGD